MQKNRNGVFSCWLSTITLYVIVFTIVMALHTDMMALVRLPDRLNDKNWKTQTKNKPLLITNWLYNEHKIEVRYTLSKYTSHVIQEQCFVHMIVIDIYVNANKCCIF